MQYVARLDRRAGYPELCACTGPTSTGLPASRADDVFRRRRRWRTPVSSYITADMTCVLRIYHVWLGGTYNPINRFECTLTRNGRRLRRRSTNSAIARKLQLHVHSHKQTSCHRTASHMQHRCCPWRIRLKISTAGKYAAYGHAHV